MAERIAGDGGPVGRLHRRAGRRERLRCWRLRADRQCALRRRGIASPDAANGGQAGDRAGAGRGEDWTPVDSYLAASPRRISSSVPKACRRTPPGIADMKKPDMAQTAEQLLADRLASRRAADRPTGAARARRGRNWKRGQPSKRRLPITEAEDGEASFAVAAE